MILKNLICLFSVVLSAVTLGKQPLVISFDGKGAALAWDAGVITALSERLKRDRVSEMIFVGSSSGSLVASFFACRGLSSQSIQELQPLINSFSKDTLDENPKKRAFQLILGIKPEIPISSVEPLLNFATQQGTCIPSHPLLIPAANLEVLESRTKKPFAGNKGKVVSLENHDVTVNNKVIGKACTYFVNESMRQLISKVPIKERLCDLRLIRSGTELKSAILASISEPTYLDPVKEKAPHLVESNYPVDSSRQYLGGFIMNSPVQEVKRALPEAYVFGTGRVTYTRLQHRIILNWFRFPMNDTLLNQRWFFDEQIVLSRKEWDELYEKKVSFRDQFNRGYAAATQCFDTHGCLPKLNKSPGFSNDIYGQPLKDKRGRGIKIFF